MAIQHTRPEHLLVDTHTHIYYHVDSDELNEQMARCQENGIEKLVLPNVDIDSIAKVFRTTEAYPEHCFAMLGLHPCSVSEDYKQVLTHIEKEIPNRSISGIGEIGIDLYWDQSTLSWQQDAFVQQMRWSTQLKLPISIHCRDAFDEVFNSIEQFSDRRLFGVFHCFTGDLQQAQRAIDLGLKLGIGGVVTFKNSGLDKVVSQIDPKHIVLETDSPYLAPTPKRGKPNESSYLIHIAQKVADLYQMSLSELARITTENARQVFNF
ncbi:MAG TPA: TatD family hydrolase [Candidatus Sphingobacterium stercorigallinarum]|nr:TatD family hydrolase [Candidatus Sphingobacterium stercorigallinarum]